MTTEIKEDKRSLHRPGWDHFGVVRVPGENDFEIGSELEGKFAQIKTNNGIYTRARISRVGRETLSVHYVRKVTRDRKTKELVPEWKSDVIKKRDVQNIRIYRD